MENGFITQYPTAPNEWVYKEYDGGTRVYTDYVIRPINSEPWSECTTAEKEEWEREHPEPEHDEPEV